MQSTQRPSKRPQCLPKSQLDTLPRLSSPRCAAAAAEVRDLVAVYKNPPYPIFYDVVYHSYALVPMLASPLYYSSKFSSTVLTSFITGAAAVRRHCVPSERSCKQGTCPTLGSWRSA